MNIKNNFATISSLIVVALAISGGGYLLYGATNATNNEVATSTEEIVLKHGTLLVDGILEEVPYVAMADASTLAILRAITDGRKILITTKEYEGLGTLVTAIGQNENGTDGKYWQYTINGAAPTVGADAYIPQEGDVIAWMFSSSAF